MTKTTIEPRRPDVPSTGGRRSLRLRLLGGSAFLIVLFLGAVALLVMVPRMLRAGDKPATLVVASLPFWNLSAGDTVLAANPGTFNEVSPWIYGLARNGQIVPQAPEVAAQTAAGMAQLRKLGIPVVPTIANRTNDRWAYEPVADILHDPAAMTRHVNDIVALVQRENYAGIDIDYEDLPATDRKVFTTFITDLAGALHSKGKVLSVALFAKTSDAGDDQRNAGQDYAAIGAAADEVRLMAYDYHWSGSTAGSVAPMPWVRDVLAYAKTQIPPEKIVLGIALSGYDWVGDQAEVVTWIQCYGRAQKYHATTQWDRLSESPSFKYTDEQGREHEVWFENADSMAFKLEAAKAAGIRGVYLWMISSEDDRSWATLRKVIPLHPTSSAEGTSR
ncbi:MAG TPA: glycosyl hydrolase family 18 protein [Pseudonocardiaceae bacterium]|nr:glycosyl hydrolase family 18 protein [Pseudonocardiaceae bacterium]